MQSPHLIDARVIRVGLDNWFMRLVYSYEDEKGVIRKAVLAYYETVNTKEKEHDKS